MTNLFQSLTRSSSPLSFDDWLQQFTFNGLSYSLTSPTQTLGEKQEEIAGNLAGYVEGAYKSNGVVFACMLVRLLLFSEARFSFRRLVLGRPGELFGTRDLRILETPWPGGTTGDLLARAIQDVDLTGNFFAVKRPGRIKRLRPDWVTIMLGSGGAGDIDAEVVGYLYHPGGHHSTADPVPLLREEVAHFAPTPDPMSSYRGMSWLTPVVREIMGDKAAMHHKLQYFENGASPNLVVSLDKNLKPEAFERWVEMFEKRYTGLENAYKTLYLGGGADAEVVGANLRQVDFTDVTGSGETRIAAAAGVPPVIVGLSEGLKAATYSNYGQARRRFADGTMRPLWRNIAGSMATIVPPPPGSELWYDDRDISFLQEDRQDAAEILKAEAETIRTLVEAGYEPESVIQAVKAGDMSRLKHSGLVSVQMQTPGDAKSNGRSEASVLADPRKQLEEQT